MTTESNSVKLDDDKKQIAKIEGIVEELTPTQQVFKSIRDDISILERAIVSRENRLFIRSIRAMSNLRTKLTRPVLAALVEQYSLSAVLSHFLSDEYAVTHRGKTDTASSSSSSSSSMSVESGDGDVDVDVDVEDEPLVLDSLRRVFSPIYQRQPSIDILTGAPKQKQNNNDNSQTTSTSTQVGKQEEKGEKTQEVPDISPEVRLYLHLLIVMYLFDSGHIGASASCVRSAVEFLELHNRRSLDWLSSKVYSFFALTHSRLDTPAQLSSIRAPLLQSHRRAVLHHNTPGQAALVVALLHNYTAFHLYGLADTFRLKSTFPSETLSSNGLLARYLYYTGLINAVHLNYGDAHTALVAALRKAPQRAAIGFREKTTKLTILVQLLMGDIPARSTFNTADLKSALVPYLQLTRAVRKGDVEKFNSVNQEYQAQFTQDNTLTLIQRLRHNVIKAGLRKINLAYSKISLKDIASLLRVDASAVDIESIVVKAISDGVIDAVVDVSGGGIVESSQAGDAYATSEPQHQFQKRIEYTIQIHNEAVKAMSFPKNAHRKNDLDEDDDNEDEEGNSLSRKKREEKKENKEDKQEEKKDKK